MTQWNVLRAAGVAAYLALFLSVAWGLVSSTSLVNKRISKPASTMFHGTVASAGLAFLAIHLGGLFLDRFMPFGAAELLVPFKTTFHPIPVAFGIVAMYGMVVVLVSSWARKRVGTVWWRRLHLLSVPIFTLSLLHGLFAGTDSARPWMFGIYVVSGCLVLFMLIVRGLTYGFRPPRPEPVERAARPTPSATERVPAA